VKEIIARGLFAKFSQYLSLLSPRPFGFQAEGILHAIGDLTGLESMQPGIRTTEKMKNPKSQRREKFWPSYVVNKLFPSSFSIQKPRTYFAGSCFDLGHLLHKGIYLC